MANGLLVGPRPPPHGEYTLEAQRPRKRLQKPFLKQPKQQQPSFCNTSGFFGTSPGKSKSSRGTRLWDRARTPPLQTTIPPPDLSDAKWADYLHRSPSIGCPEHQDGVVNIIPEFAHLGVHRLERSSHMESQHSTPDSTASTESARLRRHAKTPVFRVGQLEGAAARMKRQLKRQSAEMGALDFERLAQNSPWRGPHSAPLPNVRHRHLQGRSLPPLPGRRRSPSDLSSASLPSSISSSSSVGSPPSLYRGRQSPLSENGTLVSFDDETIYFRPTSFCLEPSSPPVNPYDFPTASSSPVQTSIGLQICLDLLMRELSSAFHERAYRSPGTNQSHLQVWVMIEAYERLREQLLSDMSLQLSPDDTRAAESMITTWLRALYGIHESLTRHPRYNDGDGLLSEDLD